MNNYKKIIAKNYQEAMMQMRKQYGDKAIPVSHVNIKEGGLFKSKFFGHAAVELTVAVPSAKIGVSATSKPKSTFDALVGEKSDLFSTTTKALETNSYSKNKKINNPLMDEVNKIVESQNAEKIINTVENKAVNSETVKFEKELEEIKKSLEALISKQGQNENRYTDKSFDPQLEKYNEIMKNNDYEEIERSQILAEVKNTMSNEDLKDKYKIEKSFRDVISSKIVTSGTLHSGRSRKKVYMFVGPTGVGKTTTLAKLGATLRLKEGKDIAFITIDNYRIAATEQLKKYAEIMKIPLYAINDQKEFKDVIAKEKAEIILVDTSGRSHRNALKISEIKSYADSVTSCDVEKILCVSANTKKADLDNVFAAFNILDIDNVIITKTDETSFIGNVLNVADKYNKPISYYTNGQDVPDDVCVAESEKLAELVMGNQLQV